MSQVASPAGALVAEAAARLAAASIGDPRREAWLLLGLVLAEDAGALALTPERKLGETETAAYRAAAARRAAREPFAHIAASRGFWSLDLEVTPATLIPRPETELLVEAALACAGSRAAALEILDLGTGSGAILLALLAELPNASGFGVDVSLAALEVARRNALRTGAGDRVRFGRSSWWSHVRGQFDLVVSNPPYIRSPDIAGLEPEIRDHEPILALDGGPDGLGAYRAIAAGIDAHLSPGGVLLVEVGQGQAADVAALFGARGLAQTRIYPDLSGIPRMVAAVRPGGTLPSLTDGNDKSCWTGRVNGVNSPLGEGCSSPRVTRQADKSAGEGVARR